MRTLAFVFMFFTTAQAMIDLETRAFNNQLVDFDNSYLAFRKLYCTVPDHVETVTVPCVMGDIFPYAEWKRTREYAKKFFGLKEK